MLLLLFLGGVFVQTAAAAALSPAQAREAMQEFAGADTNGDGYLVPGEIMAMDEVRTQPTAAEVEPRARPVARARARVSGSGSGFRRPKQHTSFLPCAGRGVPVSPRLAVRGGAGEQAAPRDRSAFVATS